MIRVGVLLIGQAPRDDLMEVLDDLPDAYPFEARGALDGLEAAYLPAVTEGGYPLTTRLRDGSVVSVDEQFLLPLVQGAVTYFEASDASVLFLMCAGEFGGLKSRLPLFNPFRLTAALLRTVGCERVAVLVPKPEQVAPAEEKWKRAGLVPHVVSFEPLAGDGATPGSGDVDLRFAATLDAVVLDYVGSKRSLVEGVRNLVGPPVFDVGRVAAAALRSTLGHPSPDGSLAAAGGADS